MLKISHVSKTFYPGTVNETPALRDVSLQAGEGDFITILGANGAGKSTLFNAISGVFPIDEGQILLNGEDITGLPDYRRSKWIGRLFQNPMLGTAPSMTVEENLALACLRASPRRFPLSMVSAADKKMFREKLAQLDMGLENRMQHRVGLLSGGQRQALTLLMATIVPPKLLLLDEHTAALDPAAGEKVLSLTRRTVEENGITCLMITHHIPSALALGNRTILMSGGRIVTEISGEARRGLTSGQLLKIFRESAGEEMESDRILFG